MIKRINRNIEKNMFNLLHLDLLSKLPVQAVRRSENPLAADKGAAAPHELRVWAWSNTLEQHSHESLL